jgi:hypothetical protein
MSAGKYSFVIEQGATFELELQYTDPEGNAINLNGYNGRMQARPSNTSDTVYFTLSSSLDACGTGLNFSGSSGDKDPSSGSIGIYISAASSSAFDFTQGVYDLTIYSGSGDCTYVLRLLEGNVKLSNDVTRPSY